jgi:VCBS repeat-containing protein
LSRLDHQGAAEVELKQGEAQCDTLIVGRVVGQAEPVGVEIEGVEAGERVLVALEARALGVGI